MNRCTTIIKWARTTIPCSITYLVYLNFHEVRYKYYKVGRALSQSEERVIIKKDRPFITKLSKFITQAGNYYK